MTSNDPGLPPLVQIGQQTAWNACIQVEVGGYGTKRLPSQKENLVAAAWLESLSKMDVASLEGGSSLGSCNSNGGSGLTFDNAITPNDLETLPSSATSSFLSVRTGSVFTQKCVSTYGIQDLVGNVWHQVSDQIGGCDSSTNVCVTLPHSGIDPSNTDWSTIIWDGTVGPGGGGTTLTNWSFNAESLIRHSFLPAVGLPLVTGVSGSYDSLPIRHRGRKF